VAGRGSGGERPEAHHGSGGGRNRGQDNAVRGLSGGRRWAPLELGRRREGSAAGATSRRASFSVV
jgi:hypothetical protein